MGGNPDIIGQPVDQSSGYFSVEPLFLQAGLELSLSSHPGRGPALASLPSTKVLGYFHRVPAGLAGLYQMKNAVSFQRRPVRPSLSFTYQQSPTTSTGPIGVVGVLGAVGAVRRSWRSPHVDPSSFTTRLGKSVYDSLNENAIGKCREWLFLPFDSPEQMSYLNNL